MLVVDNGSTDDSAALAGAAGARVVREACPGYGAALRRGFTEARGRFIVMADADDTYDLASLAALVTPLQDGFDLALGNRLAGVQPGAMPWLHRRIGTPLISWVLRRTYGVHIRDSQSGLRALTRPAIDRLRLRSSGMELASEMIAKAAIQGLRIAEIPTSYGPREGESKLRTLRDGWRHLRLILLLTPALLYVLPSAILLTLGSLTFVLGFTASSADIGGLRWQPVFAGPIFWVLGVSGLAFGLVAHRRLVQTGLARPSRWLARIYPLVHLETALALATLAVLGGVGIDVFIFVQWVGGAASTAGAQLAALAQALIISGVHLAFIAFLGAAPD